MFSRKRNFLPSQLLPMLDVFKKRKIDCVVITGDLSTTARKEEFLMAQQFVQSLKNAGLLVFVMPGNHDQYVKSAYKKQLFYQY